MVRPTVLHICALLSVLLAVPGCRTAAPAASESALRATPRKAISTRTADVLGAAEIGSAPLGVENAYDAVMRFRPNLLRPRPVADGTRQPPTVFLDNARQGGPEVLRSIPVGAIYEIRYYTAMAAWRFGPNFPGGVISVETRR